MSPPPQDAVAYRLDALERGQERLGNFKASQRQVDDLASRVGYLDEEKASKADVETVRADIRDLRDDLRSLRTAIIGGSIAIAAGVIVFALNVLLNGHHP